MNEIANSKVYCPRGLAVIFSEALGVHWIFEHNWGVFWGLGRGNAGFELFAPLAPRAEVGGVFGCGGFFGEKIKLE